MQKSLAVLAVVAAGLSITTSAHAYIPVYGYDLIDTYPHDSSAFTQGLYYRDGYLYESTGLYGKSSVRKVVPETGSVVKIHRLNSSYFGEGLTLRDSLIYQITWRENTGFVYVEHLEFDQIDTFTYPSDGWGLTHDDSSLIMSDGSNRLYRLDPVTYAVTDTVNVFADGGPVTQINEMEMIRGKIYANILNSDYIAVIEPSTGQVEAWLDLTGIGGPSPPGPLNGIAFRPDSVRLYVTGKYWPEMYEIWVDPLDRPPEIVARSPGSDVCAYIDTPLTLSVSASDQDTTDVLTYAWSVNGVVDGTAEDSLFEYVAPASRIDTVMAVVSDGVFADSTSWTIYVEIAGITDDRPGSPDVPRDGHDGQAVFHQNSPNPFWPATIIRFAVPEGSRSHPVRLTVHDIQGRLVRTLVDSEVAGGGHETIWDGTDDNGKQVHPGIFFSVLEVDGRTFSRKMICIK